MGSERVIRISDLFWYILSKWKLLILAVVIGALLCGGYKYASAGRRSASGSSQESSKSAASDGLGSYDHAAANLFFRYLALTEEQMEYIRTAEFMQIDPYHADVSSASFSIRCEKEEDTDAVLEAYVSVLAEKTAQYGELVSYSVEKGYSNYYAPANEIETAVFEQSDARSGIISVKIFGADETACRDRIQEISDGILSSAADIASRISDHTIQQVGEYTAKVSSPELLQLQKNAADTLYQMTNYMNNIQKSFSADATDYVNDMTAKGAIPDIVELAAGNTEEKTETAQAAPVVRSGAKAKKALMKGAFLGGAGLLILAVILLCLYYILSGKLRFEDDINSLFGVSCLGIVSDPSKKKKTGIDRAIEEKRYRIRGLRKDTAEIIAANLELAGKTAGAQTLYATGTVFGEKEKQLAEELKTLLQGKGLDLIVGEPLLADAASIGEMGKTGRTVLIETADATGRTDLAGKLAFCRENQIDTLGMVILA